MASTGQADWGAGIYRGREAPVNAAYDLLNCLLDDENQPFRRGGSAYLSTANAGATLLGLSVANLAPGQRVAAWSSSAFYVLDGANAPVTITSTAGEIPAPLLRPVVIAGMLIALSATKDALTRYGGALTAADSTAGTITIANGDIAVAGVGTSFTAVSPGALLFAGATGLGWPVRSIGSNTSLTLASPWPYSSFAAEGTLLFSNQVGAPTGSGQVYTCLGSAGTPPRLFLAWDNNIAFSLPGMPFTFNKTGSVLTDVHELPTDALVLGLQGLGDSILVFTTTGTWQIDNINFDPIDDAGNVQHIVRRLNELVLWGEGGLVEWRGAVVLPAIDGVWLVPPGEAPERIAVGIWPLYRSYVQAGYQPGLATVHRGHYFLPIVNGTTLVDVLVCRLDQGAPWTRWAGHGASIGYAQRIGSTSRSPKLYAVAAQRVTDLTDAWSPSASNASEADASTHSISIETRDLPTPGGWDGATTDYLRIRYEAVAAAAPTFTVSYARGLEGSAYSALTTADGVAAGTSDGLREKAWRVVRKAPAIRFKIASSSALSSFTLRSVRAEYSPDGEG